MIRYRCDHCNTFFDEPSSIDYIDHLGEFTRRYTDYHCPICGCDSFSEADYCPKCDEPKMKEDILCRGCRQHLFKRFVDFADKLTAEEEDQLDEWLYGCSVKERLKWT